MKMVMKCKHSLVRCILLLFFAGLSISVVRAESAVTSGLDEASKIYQGEYLTGVDFPVGAMGGGVIRMNGKAERRWWQIFGNHEERVGSGMVPNSFFALRTEVNGSTEIRALQTSAVGGFQAMERLRFQTEYPFGWYHFEDAGLPVEVTLEVYNPLIPMDMKNSAIPCGIFRFRVSNPSTKDVKVSLLGTQQNAVGFDGYGVVEGADHRNFSGYGANTNRIVACAGKTSLKMTGPKGSLQLSVYDEGAGYTASWESLNTLRADFAADGTLTGGETAVSPKPGVTVDGALATGFLLKPGGEKVVTFVLSWHMPKGTFGRKGKPEWYFPEAGSRYENWWASADEVDRYVQDQFEYLDSTTRLYHNTLYASTLPRYLLDRLSSNISVLKSPTVFWTKDGYFGMWESTSNKEQWFGNVKHVYHYAQGHARLYPELGKTLRLQDLDSQLEDGLLPARDGQPVNALDGHFGTILGIYREHLLSDDSEFLKAAWPRTKIAMDYAIETYDGDRDGMLSGRYHNTLDCYVSGTSPWIGTLYMAALMAAEQMAALMGDADAAAEYRVLRITGIKTQNEQLWDQKFGYYIEQPEQLPDTWIMGDAVSLDMLLGQWWANQLNLGQIYPVDRTKASLSKIYTMNRFTDTGSGYKPIFRDFLGTGDTGWFMFKFPGERPPRAIKYHNEVMSGFEYAAAATMLQYGMLDEGLDMIAEISKRYDGRLRAEGEVHMKHMSTVFGTGGPVGEDECGDFYGRPLSSWSALLALQGFSYDGPKQSIGFKPVWRPENHKSFFSAAAAWGLFSQTQSGKRQIAELDVRFGILSIKYIELALPEGAKIGVSKVTCAGKPLPIEAIEQSGSSMIIALKNVCEIKPGGSLRVISECSTP